MNKITYSTCKNELYKHIVPKITIRLPSMSVPRLGYACINTVLSDRPKSQRICVNNSCIAKTFRERGAEYAIELARKNLQSVLKVLQWNEEHGIRLYRMSSDMFPHITNPEFINGNHGGYAYSLNNFDDLFQQIGEFARKHQHRLTCHPGQFNQVGTINPDVFIKTCRDLQMHADVLDRIGCGPDSVMVVHGGGVYGDKAATLERWVEQFHQLPVCAQDRLVIENCERQYNYADMLWLSARINRPVVFDTHHHSCYCTINGPLPDPSTFLPDIIKTWTVHGITPKFHISEQAPNNRIGAHSDYVANIPQYLLNILADNQPLDLMIEAKAKEQAVLQLYRDYYTFDPETNTWGF